MIPGLAVAGLVADVYPPGLVPLMIVGFASACLVASANYCINEFLDAEFDSYHPTKKTRPAAQGLVRLKPVVAEYVLLALMGLTLAWCIGKLFVTASLLWLVMGLIYNVPPLRLKEKPYIDVLSESINNVIRFVLGWGIIVDAYLPPASALFCYWFGGAFLMAVKRLAEWRFVADPAILATYRKSFAYYNAESLLLSSFLYGITSSLFLGIFLVKYRIEFVLTFPFFALLFTWYLKIGLRPNSPAQYPEKLYKEKGFVSYVVFVIGMTILLFLVDIPYFHTVFEKHFYLNW